MKPSQGKQRRDEEGKPLREGRENAMKPVLLAQTNDGGWITAPPECQHSLQDWASKHRGKLYTAKSTQTPLSILQLVQALMKPNKLPRTQPPHRDLETIYEPPTKSHKPRNKTVIHGENYQDFLAQAANVREHLKELLMTGKKLNLGQISDWAKARGINLSKGGLSRHLQKVLDNATGQGYQVIKEGRTYQVITKRSQPQH